MIMSDAGEETKEPQFNSFFGSLLEPGSSFDPTFLLVVDGTFAFLFIVLTSFTILARGNVHLIFLTFIELALWASVKWHVISRSDYRWGSLNICKYISGLCTSGALRKAMVTLPASQSQKKIERIIRGYRRRGEARFCFSSPSFITGFVPPFRSPRAFLCEAEY
jgi:hypothetical protein